METQSISKSRLWTGRIMSGIVILFMLMDCIMKFVKPKEVIDGTTLLGYQEHHIITLGVLGFISIVLYIIPQTAVLGALLLTGYFGGAIATHVRVDNPLFSHVLFPIYLSILMWGGLWLRSVYLQQLVPFRVSRA